MKTAIYPGSFDPITKGHLDVLKRACNIFDEVIIAVLNNYSKEPFLSIETRIKLIKEAVCDIDNVKVDSFDGLTIDYANKIGAQIIIRGLRAVSDFEYEMQLSQTNQALDSKIHTVFLITKPKYNFISSSSVKEISKLKGDISKFVPENVVKYLNSQNNNENKIAIGLILMTLRDLGLSKIAIGSSSSVGSGRIKGKSVVVLDNDKTIKLTFENNMVKSNDNNYINDVISQIEQIKEVI